MDVVFQFILPGTFRGEKPQQSQDMLRMSFGLLIGSVGSVRIRMQWSDLTIEDFANLGWWVRQEQFSFAKNHGFSPCLARGEVDRIESSQELNECFAANIHSEPVLQLGCRLQTAHF